MKNSESDEVTQSDMRTYSWNKAGIKLKFLLRTLAL